MFGKKANPEKTESKCHMIKKSLDIMENNFDLNQGAFTRSAAVCSKSSFFAFEL